MSTRTPPRERNMDVTVFLRPIANPLPLGFVALAGATLSVSALQLGWIDADEGHSVALILIAFVFPLQLLTSVFGYLGRDVAAGTGMGVLAGTWLAVGLVMLSSAPSETSDALGMLLLVAGVAMWIPAAAASAAKRVAAAVLATAGLRFLVTGIYELTPSGSTQDLAGWVGVALCALGLYAALAMALEDARGMAVLPIGRDPTGRAQARLDAGVRNEL